MSTQNLAGFLLYDSFHGSINECISSKIATELADSQVNKFSDICIRSIAVAQRKIKCLQIKIKNEDLRNTL